MSLHRLSVQVIQAVFDAAYKAVKGGGHVDWVELPDYKFGWRTVDNVRRVTSETTVVLADKPPYRLDNPLQIKMWEATVDLKRKQVVRMFNEIINLCDGKLEGVEENGRKYFKFTEPELDDYKRPLLSQIAHFKDKAMTTEANFDSYRDIALQEIVDLRQKVKELEEANNILRESLSMTQDGALKPTSKGKKQTITVKKTILKPRAKKEPVA